jgi:hypothetical protein
VAFPRIDVLFHSIAHLPHIEAARRLIASQPVSPPKANPSNAVLNATHPYAIQHERACLWRRILLHDPLDLALIRCSVLLEEVVGISLGWRVWVWLVEQVLNAK